MAIVAFWKQTEHRASVAAAPHIPLRFDPEAIRFRTAASQRRTGIQRWWQMAAEIRRG